MIFIERNCCFSSFFSRASVFQSNERKKCKFLLFFKYFVILMNCDQAGGAVEPGALHLSGEVYKESEGSSPGAAALLSPASG